jgi:hypothetical protein
MKVNELPEKSNITNVKVKLPVDALEKYKKYAGGEEEMWIVGWTMGDFFMSSDGKDKKSRRLYPMPESIKPQDILEWEVVENLN